MFQEPRHELGGHILVNRERIGTSVECHLFAGTGSRCQSDGTRGVGSHSNLSPGGGDSGQYSGAAMGMALPLDLGSDSVSAAAAM